MAAADAIKIGPYAVIERLHEGATFQLYRARDERDGRAVVLKRLEPERATALAAARLRREHEIIQALDVPGVVKAREFLERGGAVTLVLDDFGGETLARYYARAPRGLMTTLEIAIAIAETLARVHARRVLHKDINPRNILVDAARRVQLIDFGLATQLPRELPALRNPNALEGTLAYIAPEQTGRMNRAVDSRADLYSLGATLYELLTGRAVFTARDPLALVHCHIAREPTPPHLVNDEVPRAVSRIVCRLLAKSADDRYQSANGLLGDLRECRRRLVEFGEIGALELGRSDRSTFFRLPQKLYGREDALATVEAALERVRRGGAELVLVRGPAGIGKSATIQELRRALVSIDGLFLAGKYDLLQRDVPYRGLVQALSSAASYLLAETPARLERWTARLRESVGSLGPVVLELVPALGRVLGPQGRPPELLPDAMTKRLRAAMRGVIRGLARPGHPLVLFLDDLQWADNATLELLEHLIDPEDESSLLLVGSYRDDEVDVEHPLRHALARSRGYTELELRPLTHAHIAALIADALDCDVEAVQALAEVTREKTLGNPFFVGQLLSKLHDEGLIALDERTSRWTWELDSIRASSQPDSVLELLTARLARLPARAVQLLRLAACVGSRFDLSTLALIDGAPDHEIAAALVHAAVAGMINAQGSLYSFCHDRVRQAVYEGLDDDTRRRAHLTVGRHLLARAGDAPDEDALFELLGHLDPYVERVTDPDERARLCQLNLAAGHHARASAAFEAAARYLRVAHALMPAREDPRLPRAARWTLLRSAAECEYLTGADERARDLLRELQTLARDKLERGELDLLRLSLALHRGDNQAAIAHGLRGLRRLGVKLPRRPGLASVLAELARARAALGRRSFADLLAIPVDDDARVDLARRLLVAVVAAAWGLDPNLQQVASLRAVALATRHGCASSSPPALLSYGLFVGAVTRDPTRAEAWARFAFKVFERAPTSTVEGPLRFLYGAMISHWTHPLRDSDEHLRLGYQRCMDAGMHGLAGTCRVLRASILLRSGAPLDQVLAKLEACREQARALASQEVLDNALPVLGYVEALRGAPEGLTALGGDPEERAAMLERQARRRGSGAASFVRLLEFSLLVLAREHEAARAHVEGRARELTESLRFALERASFYLYRVICLSGHPRRDRDALRTIRADTRELAHLAAHAPENFLHLQRLAEAEQARVGDAPERALTRYEEAIRLARERGYLQDEALARELFGHFLRARGSGELGLGQLLRALTLYERWGAHAKVARMLADDPELARAREPRARPDASLSVERTITATSSASVERADGEAAARSTSANQLLDIRSLLRAAESFTADHALPELIERLLRLVIENVGAERGLLLLADGDDLRVELEQSLRRGERSIHHGTPLREGELVAAGLVLLTTRGEDPIAIDDAREDPRVASDPYVQRERPRALLCAPLRLRGRLLGALYLENNLAPGVFTERRQAALRLLGLQAAIAIDHVQVYARLERARAAAEAASAAKSRFLANMSHDKHKRETA